MSETVLTLEIIGKGHTLPPLSARECVQTLTPIPQGILRRTVNGGLVCVGNPTHRKFHSTLQCKDKATPAFADLWIGVLVRVGCIQWLTQRAPPQCLSLQLEREAVDLYAYDASQKIWPLECGKDRWTSLPSEFPGGFVTYRPSLIMLVKNYQLETDEWGLTVGWRCELEEQ